MTVKVNYDTETTLVKGYYPDSINYASIPEPFIEITDEQHQAALSKTMCVVNGVFQEYVKPDSLLLEELKAQKIAQCKAYLASTDWEHTAFIERGRAYDETKAKRLLAVSYQDDIAAITADGEYFDQNQQPITALQALENINTAFAL